MKSFIGIIDNNWTYFDAHSDTIHLLGCHNSWRMFVGVFKDNIVVSTKKSQPTLKLIGYLNKLQGLIVSWRRAA